MLVDPHIAKAVVVVPSTPVIRELLGDPDLWGIYPCKCDDCVARGRAVRNFFPPSETLRREDEDNWRFWLTAWGPDDEDNS